MVISDEQIKANLYAHMLYIIFVVSKNALKDNQEKYNFN